MPITKNTHQPHMISLKKMCDQVGEPNLFPTIRNHMSMLKNTSIRDEKQNSLLQIAKDCR